MKYLVKSLFLFLFLLPILISGQEVTTLANVTANGGVTLDADGNLFVAHFGPLPFVTGEEGKNIYKITPSGEVSIFVNDQLTVGSGNHFDSQGFLYQANFQIGRVFKIDVNGDVVDNNFATIVGPVGITIIENDTVVVCECNTGSIKKIAQDGTVTTLAQSTLFACVNGITKDETGTFYTTNFSNGVLNRVAKNGDVTTLGSTTFGNGHLTYRALDQHLYIAGYSSNQIYKMDLNGEVSLFAGTGLPGTFDSTDPLSATFDKPNGIEISNDGCSLYITQDQHVVREIKLNDYGCTTSASMEEEEADIILYPNPSKGKVSVKSKNFVFKKVQILDTSGSLLLEVDFKEDTNLDLTALNSGSYLVLFITADDKMHLKRIVLE